MPIDLYLEVGSGPCRSVRLVAAALGVDINLKKIELMKGDQMKPEFLKMNPMHCVPTIDDNGFYLWESRAINAYLADQYGKNDSLYPKDPKKRALVNNRMYFDLDVLYRSFSEFYYPQVFGGAPADSEKAKKCDEALKHLDDFLDGQKYVAGNQLTIADLVLVPTVSNFELIKFDLSKYKNVSSWLARMKSEAPKYDECNGEGVRAFQMLIEQMSKK